MSAVVAGPRSEEGGALAAAWRVLASERTSAVLVFLLAGAAALAAWIPQGKDALQAARSAQATALHRFAELGLTDVFGSPWVFALGVLLAGNLVAFMIGDVIRSRAEPGVRAVPPRAPAEKVELSAALPELAVEQVRAALNERLGAPAAERVDGSKVTLVYDPGAGLSLAPLLSHVGLLMLVVASGLEARDAGERPRIARAELEITDPGTRAVGHFDMVAGEPFTFFQRPERYVLRDYDPNRDGLGPAVRLDRFGENGQDQTSFWIYERAPKGFDARHRKGDVAIRALWMKMAAVPGSGVTSRPGVGALLVLGFALIGIAAVQAGRARARLWVEVDGDLVRLSAQPARGGEEDLPRAFSVWTAAARAAVER